MKIALKQKNNDQRGDIIRCWFAYSLCLLSAVEDDLIVLFGLVQKMAFLGKLKKYLNKKRMSRKNQRFFINIAPKYQN